MRVILAVAFACVASAALRAQTPVVTPLDNFQSDDLAQWQSSMSPEYYKGGTGRARLQIVDDPERGRVLSCGVLFRDPRSSEPAFITRQLEPKPGKLNVTGVRFWAKLTEPAIAPKGGFKVRLRTGDAAFTDYDVQEQLGHPFPAGEWVHVELDTAISPKVRNIWGTLFGTVRQMTFRLDDIDAQNAEFALLLDDIELLLKQPVAETLYEPKPASRPDDGRTRILLLKHRAAGYYGIEQAAKEVEPAVQIDTFHYRGLHFEFFGFPERPQDVLAYDAIIMVDVDPFMMTYEQCAWIADAVASGSSLLLFGGSVTLTHARDVKMPLRSVLPVDFEKGAKDLSITTVPRPGEAHVLNQGLDPAGLGLVRAVQALIPKPDAVVLWYAGSKPLIITMPVRNGQATVVNTWPHVAGSARGDFFTSDLSDELMRRLIRFCLGRTDRPSIAPRQDLSTVPQTSLKLDVAWVRNKFTFAPGSRIEFTVRAAPRGLPQVQPGERTQIRFADGTFPVTLDSFVDSWVYKPGTDTSIHSQVGAADVKIETHESWLPAWTVTGEPRCARRDSDLKFDEDSRILACRRQIETQADGTVQIRTRYRFLKDMKVQKLPLTVNLPTGDYAGLAYRAEQTQGTTEGLFPNQTKRGTMFDGTGLDLAIETPAGPIRIRVTDPTLRVWLRDLRQYNMRTFRLEIEAPFENRDAKRGDEYTIALLINGPVSASDSDTAGGQLQPTAATASGPPEFTAILVDDHGFSWSIPTLTAQAGFARYGGPLPNLASGAYSLEVQAMVGGRPIAVHREPCFVVDPLDRTGFFPIMSIIGISADGHYLAEAGIRDRIEDLSAHGFNTAAITGTSNFQSDTPSNAQRLVAYSESYAQQRGMATTYEYSNFTIVKHHARTKPCVFNPEFHGALEQKLASQIDIGNRTPRLLTAKVIDEPYTGVSDMDFCEYCKAEFKGRYGIEMREGMDVDESPFARWALADFIGHYVSVAYAQGAELMRKHDATFDLLLTYMSTGLGYQRPLKGQQDTLDWSRHVKWADFDVYPYFYPRSQRLRMVQASFAMTFMRDVARARGIPWGFYIELDDRNWPFQKNPREATAECGFTAIAHGADYLNSFINRIVGTGTQSRPERWEAAGRALRAIRRIGPVLNAMPAVRAPVAILYPNTQEAIADGYEQPEYLLQALKGGFGPVDIHNEQTIVENGTIPYRALFLLKTEFVHADLPPILTAWLENGGILFCDQLPTKTHRNADIAWPPDTVAKPVRERRILGDSVLVSERTLGNGTLVSIDGDLESRFKDMAEADTPDGSKVRDFRTALAILLHHRLASTAQIQYSESSESVDIVEAGIRGNEDAFLAIVVNHQPQSQSVKLDVIRPGILWLVDVDSMEPVAFETVKDAAITTQIEVDGRWARMLAGYRQKPENVRIKVQTERVKSGQTLSYEVELLDGKRDRVRGGVLLETAVRDPDGNVVTRFGGSRAPVDGVAEFAIPVPVNAKPGAYTITTQAPQAKLKQTATFEVR